MGSILVVEDDPDIRELLVDILQCEGFEAQSARHGKDALEQLEAGFLPDLILLDLMMPVMDGWTLQTLLAKSERWGTIPIIILSASLPQREAASLRNFLPKPVELDRLSKVIRAQMPSGRAPPV